MPAAGMARLLSVGNTVAPGPRRVQSTGLAAAAQLGTVSQARTVSSRSSTWAPACAPRASPAVNAAGVSRARRGSGRSRDQDLHEVLAGRTLRRVRLPPIRVPPPSSPWLLMTRVRRRCRNPAMTFRAAGSLIPWLTHAEREDLCQQPHVPACGIELIEYLFSRATSWTGRQMFLTPIGRQASLTE
jgi:hypothetical protein